jgi:hypothetical protein
MILYTTKEGKLRWLAISSTAYRDRDDEIVSTKALREAVARAHSSKEFGPLRFWHTPGIELGTTDYMELSEDGKYLIESGIIRADIADSVKESAKSTKWQMSIGFKHPRTEPDKDKVFHNISIFERSVVPQGKAANSQTTLQLGKG